MICTQRARNNVNICKSPGTLSDLVRPLVILSEVIAGRNIPNNKNQPTAHASYLTSEKVFDFFRFFKEWCAASLTLSSNKTTLKPLGNK